MPSPRPVRPRPSVVVPDTLTGAPPSASDSTFSASPRRGAIRGRLPTTQMATLPTTKPALASRAAVARSRPVPAAPAQAGSSVPKTAPRSPRAAADSRASQAACATTSPSECPARPSSPGHSSPARYSGRPGSSGWTSVPTPTRGRSPAMPGSVASGRQDLVEQGLGLVLVGLLGQGQLADQDLPGLGQHPLLAGRQATLAVPAPQIADDLGHLVHVAGGELLQVGLVPPRPVGRLLGVRGAQHLEHALQSFLPHHVAHAYQFGIVRGHTYGQIALVDLEDQVGLVLTLDRPGLDLFDA